ncbi:MAG: hypothetical protein ABI467_13020 [Kofleriaceae bacterium]
MTDRITAFDTDEFELLFSEADQRPATPATTALSGAFAACLPRGVELAIGDDDREVELAVGDDDRETELAASPIARDRTVARVGLATHSAPRRADAARPASPRDTSAPRGADAGHPATSVPRGADSIRAAAAHESPAHESTAASARRDLPTTFSPDHTVMTSAENLRLAVAFDHLELELVRLGRRWKPHAPCERIGSIVGDFAAFMRILLEDVELEPVYSRSAESPMLVHDTYVRLITVAGVLREAIEGRWANAADLASAYAHAEATLDAFTPFVGLADRAMRRICLEAETLEGALRWLSRQLDEEAAERLRAAEAFVPHGLSRSRFHDN